MDTDQEPDFFESTYAGSGRASTGDKCIELSGGTDRSDDGVGGRVPTSDETSIDEYESCLSARVVVKPLAPNSRLLKERLGENDAVRSCLSVNLF